MDLIAEADLDRPAAIRAIPALIKAYLRLGGFVGQGAYHRPRRSTASMSASSWMWRGSREKHRAIYQRGGAA